MGRSKSALPDLDKVITMKPDFVSARLQRGNIHLKQGTFEDARRDFEGVLHLAPDNDEALRKLEEVQPLEQALSDAEHLLRFVVWGRKECIYHRSLTNHLSFDSEKMSF